MNLILGFLFGALLLGLFAPRKRMLVFVLPAAAFLMVLFMLISPHRM